MYSVLTQNTHPLYLHGFASLEVFNPERDEGFLLRVSISTVQRLPSLGTCLCSPTRRGSFVSGRSAADQRGLLSPLHPRVATTPLLPPSVLSIRFLLRKQVWARWAPGGLRPQLPYAPRNAQCLAHSWAHGRLLATMGTQGWVDIRVDRPVIRGTEERGQN